MSLIERQEYHNESHIAENNLLSQAIWPDDIEETKNQIHLGDVIKVRSIKDTDEAGNQNKYGIPKYGHVIYKTDYFMTVRFASGVCESYTWVQMIQEHRESLKGGKKHEEVE